MNVSERKEGHWQGFPVIARRMEFYRHECDRNGLSCTDLGSLKNLGRVSDVESQDSQRMLKITRIQAKPDISPWAAR